MELRADGKLICRVTAKKAKENGDEILYVDYAQNMYMTNRIPSINDDEKKLWVVEQASFNDDGKILLYFIFTGNVQMPDVVSVNLSDALTTLKKAGFSSIEYNADDGGIIWNDADWKVTAQSVKAGDSVSANEKIVLTVINTKLSEYKAESEVSDEEKANEKIVLTVDNCEELAAILTNKASDPEAVSKFLSNHTGDIIEFEAIVLNVERIENYKTRFDFLIVPGEGTEATGATIFTIPNASYLDFKFESGNPEQITIGTNLRIQATVKGSYGSYIEIKPLKSWGRR